MSLKSKSFYSTLLDKAQLNPSNPEKCTYHLSLCLKDSGVNYRPGDCIGIYPHNNSDLVKKTIEMMKLSPDALVQHKKHGELSLQDLLLTKVNITRLTKPIVKAVMNQETNLDKKSALEKILLPENRELFQAFIAEYELWDFLEEHHEVKLSIEDWGRLLPPLTPRLYSISSSQSMHSSEVHLLIGLTQFTSRGKERLGVCSNYLFNQGIGSQVEAYYHKTPDFLLPEDSSTPIIMVGPGTGVAPFRAFMQERVASSSTGESWLFFGECHESSDYYYQSEWKDFEKEGNFKVTTAFSRDQSHKIYVQDRILEHQEELYKLLKKGAYIYVCGDAQRMAPSVDEAFTKIIASQSGQSIEDAKVILDEMKQEKRYLKDVY